MLLDIAFDNLNKLPTLSPATNKIIELANNSNTVHNDLVKIIETDPVMTGKILSLVNSTYFSLRDHIFSLKRAIILLGFNTIKHIAISSSLVGAIGTEGGNKHFEYIDVWKHMLAVGVTSKILSIKMNVESKQEEQFFIAGLLHDIGDILMIKFFPEEYYELTVSAEERGCSIVQISKEKYNSTPNKMGAKAARTWKLPKPLCEVIEHSRNPSEESSSMTQTVYIADKICRKFNFGFSCDQYATNLTTSEFQMVNLERNELEPLQELIQVELEKASVFIE